VVDTSDGQAWDGDIQVRESHHDPWPYMGRDIHHESPSRQQNEDGTHERLPSIDLNALFVALEEKKKRRRGKEQIRQERCLVRDEVEEEARELECEVESWSEAQKGIVVGGILEFPVPLIERGMRILEDFLQFYHLLWFFLFHLLRSARLVSRGVR
jgi:hypothetical protein